MRLFISMAYSIGNVSGCHVNPAVSIGVLVSGGMSVADFIGYVISQCIGAILGAAVLKGIFSLGDVTDMTGGLGSNGLAGVNGSVGAGLLVEILLTFIFVLTILGVTSSKFRHGSFGGLIIGLTLVVIHIIGIGLTQLFAWEGKHLFDFLNTLVFIALAFLIYKIGTGKKLSEDRKSTRLNSSH